MPTPKPGGRGNLPAVATENTGQHVKVPKMQSDSLATLHGTFRQSCSELFQCHIAYRCLLKPGLVSLAKLRERRCTSLVLVQPLFKRLLIAELLPQRPHRSTQHRLLQEWRPIKQSTIQRIRPLVPWSDRIQPISEWPSNFSLIFASMAHEHVGVGRTFRRRNGDVTDCVGKKITRGFSH